MGRIQALIALGAGFNPVLSGRENIYVNASLLGISQSEVKSHFEEIVGFSELEDFIDAPVQSYSSGMIVRLGFAVGAFLHPDILLLDEVLAVGDLKFQRKCQEKLKSLTELGVSCILVSHRMNHIIHTCNRVVYLEIGKKVYEGDPVTACRVYEKSLLGEVRKDNKELMAKFESSLGRTKESTGEMSIESVSVLNKDGKPSAEFMTGDDITIAARYTTSTTIIGPILQIAMYREDGITCVVERTSDNSIDVPNIPSGQGTLVFKIDQLPLKTGHYIAEILVSDSMAIASYVRKRTQPFAFVSDTPQHEVGHMGMFQTGVNFYINDSKLGERCNYGSQR
jgi:ABC-type multidrug transport system ATPase subunit